MLPPPPRPPPRPPTRRAPPRPTPPSASTCSRASAPAREEAERRAHAEAALRRVARALGAALDVREAVQRISEGAVETTRAFGAYVERFDAPRPGQLHRGGRGRRRGTPPLGTRVPYPGSLSEEILEHGEPSVMTEVGAIGERMAPYLTESCRGARGCSCRCSRGARCSARSCCCAARAGALRRRGDRPRPHPRRPRLGGAPPRAACSRASARRAPRPRRGGARPPR
jgi:hypothetical protein